MYSAPSVTFPVGRCRLYAWALVALGVVGLTVLAFWMLGNAQHRPWLAGVGVAIWLGWVVFAVWSWRRSPVGHLRWDATSLTPDLARPGAWLWRSALSTEGTPLRRVDRIIDLQSHVLLCLLSADALTRWVWVERVRDPVRWHDLRCALVAHT
ncbi:hypothetical protein [Hydrogenophaga sp.]|uniref:hypothetical protein n=1 Tax=Hydrogenophaga sp. TaxID=1904254 RepID=UPI00271BD6AA|nr:hypothetical protein [Hydrogenophaga sp.]MDO9437405.1 hypothetical protein [Hydrogenophaga sp.]